MGLRYGQRWFDGVIVHRISPLSLKSSEGPRTPLTDCGVRARTGTRVPRGAAVSCMECIAGGPLGGTSIEIKFDVKFD